MILMSNIGTKYILGDRFTFDPNSNSLVDLDSDSEVVRLGSNESRILLMLSQRPNEVVTRNELHDFVWREQGFEVDDSSLTQAISTLRKMLKDSTKSPEFVKTVPKRGYQLIANVELSSPASIKKENDETMTDTLADPSEPETGYVSTEEPETSASVPEPISQASPSSDKQTVAGRPARAKMTWAAKLMLLVALVLPVAAILLTNPSESKFRQLAVFDNVVVSTPINHPDLTSWLPSIEKCIKKYKQRHAGEESPLSIIATDGQNDQLILNYIHSRNFSGENITIRLIANQDDVDKVCQ